MSISEFIPAMKLEVSKLLFTGNFFFLFLISDLAATEFSTLCSLPCKLPSSLCALRAPSTLLTFWPFCPSLGPVPAVLAPSFRWSLDLCWSLISSPVSGPTSCCSCLDDLRPPLTFSVQANLYPHPAQEWLHSWALLLLALGSPSLLLLCPGSSTGTSSKH